VRQEIAPVNCGKHAEQDRHFDGAGGVEPAIGIAVQLESGLEIVQRDGDRFRVGFLGDLLDLALER
jgi:hypothetical protein